MRSFIQIVENTSYPTWIDHLWEAVNAANQYGFYFEEGGCWGMALALHEALPGSEIIAIYQHSGVPSHGMVRLGNIYVDWNGAHAKPWEGVERIVSIRQLFRLATNCRCDIRSDVIEARQMIENAKKLAGEIV